jgi:hypothetical protein
MRRLGGTPQRQTAAIGTGLDLISVDVLTPSAWPNRTTVPAAASDPLEAVTSRRATMGRVACSDLNFSGAFRRGARRGCVVGHSKSLNK